MLKVKTVLISALVALVTVDNLMRFNVMSPIEDELNGIIYEETVKTPKKKKKVKILFDKEGVNTNTDKGKKIIIGKDGKVKIE